MPTTPSVAAEMFSRGGDRGLEAQAAALDAVDGDLVERRVAVRVDHEVADQAAVLNRRRADAAAVGGDPVGSDPVTR